MKRKNTFHVTEKVFKAAEDMTVTGSMYSEGNYSEFKELVVHGDCVVKETIKADRLIVYGNLEAKSAIVGELHVNGNVNVFKLTIDDVEVKGNFIVNALRAHHSIVNVGGKVKINSVSGEIVELSVGE